MSKDTWSGNYSQPLSLNGWNYVEGNPINYTDFSGNWPCRGLPPCSPPILSSDPNGLFPKREPEYINWSPSVNVTIPKIFDTEGHLVPSGTNFSQKYIRDKNNKKVTGACGPVTVAAIANIDPQALFIRSYYLSWTWTKTENGVEYNYQVPVDPDQTSIDERESIIKSIPGWSAYTERSIYDMQAHEKLQTVLQMGRYPLPGVDINPANGYLSAESNAVSHWLVVTGISISSQWDLGKEWQWVRVYNPYSNQNEYYMWSWFLKNWGRIIGNRLMVVMYRNPSLSR